MNTDETLPNGTEFMDNGCRIIILANEGTHYKIQVTERNGCLSRTSVLKKYVHQWHGDYLARGLTTRGGEATGRKSRPVRIVPY